MKLREFAEAADHFFTSSGYAVFACDEFGKPHDIYYPELERASVEALFDCNVISIGNVGTRNGESFITVDVVANSNPQTLEQIIKEMRDECDEFLEYLESFKR